LEDYSAKQKQLNKQWRKMKLKELQQKHFNAIDDLDIIDGSKDLATEYSKALKKIYGIKTSSKEAFDIYHKLFPE